MPKTKIGVFDSGVGGLSVANAIQNELPDTEIIYMDDARHVPYGNRPVSEIYSFVKPIIRTMVEQGCQIIVIACNTVTTNLIEKLRQDFRVQFVGMEPMVKPAAELSSNGVIAVCATPKTLSSKRYHWLKDTYASGIKVLEPNCGDWAYMIETDNVDREKIANIVEDICNQGADVIVLGCTHYHWIELLIKELARGRAEVLQPEEPVIAQLKNVLPSI